MNKLFTLVMTLVSSVAAFCQNEIDVMESTIKVRGAGEEVFYLGFSEGDKLIFSFQEVDGKELKEIEIIELPGSSRFMDYKSAKVENKTLNIPRTAIYKFRFQNSTLRGRVCRIHIRRIPSSEETKNFNTMVYWKTLTDTTYTPTPQRFLIRADTVITKLTDQVAKVSSATAANGNPNKNLIDVVLPDGTISWSYYIGVGTEGRAAYQKAKESFIKEAGNSLAVMTGFEPTGLLAVTGINMFATVQGRDNVKYFFITDWNNAMLFMSGSAFMQYKQGDVVNDAAQIKIPNKGKIILGLINDNIMEPIEVVVKITAVQVQQLWETRTVNQMKIVQREIPFLRN